MVRYAFAATRARARMIALRITSVVLAFVWLASPAAAQHDSTDSTWGTAIHLPSTPTRTTSLRMDEAVGVAQQHNPEYLRAIAQRRATAAALRASRGSLLPQLTSSLSMQYQQGGQQIVGGSALGASSDIVQSQYNIGLTYQVNTGSFLGPRQQRASQDAVESDIVNTRETMRATVRQQYLTALQSEQRAALQDSLVANAEAQRALARGRADVGSGTALDVQRADVALGQQQVQRLQAYNQREIDRLRLFQSMGVAPDSTARLVDDFPADTIVPALESVLREARTMNPALQALRSREDAAAIGVSRQRAEYLPTLTLATGIGGYTYSYRNGDLLVNQARANVDASRASCIELQETRAAVGLPNTLSQCASFVLSDAQASAIRASNDRFPWSFTNAPRSVTAQVSLPLFDGFAREQRAQEAAVAREDARYARRTRELALETDITAAYLTLQTARLTVALQTQNAAKAREELQFVQDQYAVGIATFIDLTTSRASFAQAENDRITARYDYYKAYAALESAVGRPLR